jgi:hypothetical protein
LSDTRERVIPGSKVKKVWLREGHSTSARADLTKLNDPFGIRIRQRPQEHSVNHTEDGS